MPRAAIRQPYPRHGGPGAADTPARPDWPGSRPVVARERLAGRLLRLPEVRRVLRFTARDVFHRPDAVIATIRAVLGHLAAGA